jgi:hypothetical protein
MESGTRLGPYEIKKQLGAGGMGEVYLAEDTRLGRQVAIKVLPSEFASDGERLARFEQEARASAALNHPGIAAVYDIGVEEEGDRRIHYMVQEYLEGETLRGLLDRGNLPRRRALVLCAEIAEALSAAHEAGIVHRDLKPDNVFVLPTGRAKVLDFGLAKLTEMSAVGLSGDNSMSPTVVGTMAGTIMGTAGYMAPEQVHGENVDQRADLFALGCVLYEMLGGSRAFGGQSLPDTLAKILHQEPEPLPDLDPALARLLEKCLAKEPAERFQHADDLAVDLRYLASADRAAGSAAVSDAAAAGTGLKPLAVTALALVALAVGYAGARLIGGDTGSGGGTGGDSLQPVQLTRFSTGVIDPAVSANGQFLAFLADDPNDGWSQVYVKSLPDGPPLRLTSTPGHKRSPAFSPDGSRIAYSAIGEDWKWDTWSVSINGGDPRLMLRNANALQWTRDGRILFSQFKEGAHLGITRADESGANQEELWFPPLGFQMAHQSDLSPDGSRIVIGYMGASRGPRVQCFVSSLPVPEGEPAEPAGPCAMQVRFSVDGEWIYYHARGAPEIWRSPADGGPAEPIVEQLPGFDAMEGFALTPDGESLIYAAGTQTEQVWLRRADGSERRITFEGDAYDPQFSADGRYVLYQQAGSEGRALWRYGLSDGSREQVCQGLASRAFVVAPDGNRVLMGSTTADSRATGEPETVAGVSLTLCHIDGTEAPRVVVDDQQAFAGAPVFDPVSGGDVFYYVAQTVDGIYQLRAYDLSTDSSRVVWSASAGRQVGLVDVSSDGAWLSVKQDLAKSNAWLLPTDGSADPELIVEGWDLEWGPEGNSFIFFNDGMVSSAWQLPNPEGLLAPAGVPTRPDAEALRGAGATRLMSAMGFSRASASPRLYEAAYSTGERRTNLYQVGLPR